MTIMIDELDLPGSRDTEPANGVTCSWCGEVFETDGKILSGSMCQPCYAKMLADFQKAQQQLTPTPPHASER